MPRMLSNIRQAIMIAAKTAEIIAVAGIEAIATFTINVVNDQNGISKSVITTRVRFEGWLVVMRSSYKTIGEQGWLSSQPQY